jgi:hypothetical protein
MRNKKPAPLEPTPEQVAVEQHVEALMNPDKPEIPSEVAKPAADLAVAPLDIFQGMPAAKIPIGGSATGPVKSAPEIPGKAGKSLFASIDALQRKDDTNLKQPLGTPSPAASPPKPVSPFTPIPPKTVTLGGSPPADSAVAVRVDTLARREEFVDSTIDSAIDDIVAKEGDDLLAAEDTVRAQQAAPVFKKSKRAIPLAKIFKSKWLLLLIPLILIALGVVPYTRYKIAGLVVQKSLTLTVVDSKTNKPVSNAQINYGGTSTKTNATGQAELVVPLGKGTLTVTKEYYKPFSQLDTIEIGTNLAPQKVSLVATGRQVQLTILNKLTNQPLSAVTLHILSTSAVSDKAGKISIVLPAKHSTETASISASGYNTLTVTIQITDNVVAGNKFALTPAGRLYFLSKVSGKINLVKANLDGSGLSTVLAGTGQEEPSTTSLVASRDWRYVVLRSRRDNSQTGMYLIDTTTDKVTQFDTANASYTPIGWSGHNFVYDVVRTTQAQSQSGRESLKSYNADQQQLNQLDQTQALGTASSDAYQTFNSFFIVDGSIVYNAQWTASGSSGTAYDLTSQMGSFRSVGVSGQAKRDLQAYPALDVAYVQAVHPVPGTVDFAVHYNTASKTDYYTYSNGAVASDSTQTAATFAKTYPVYLQSPDATRAFWNDIVSGSQKLLLGDKNAGASTPLSSAGDYTAYGWYTAQYLLLSRAGTGLYVIPVTGLGSSRAPLKAGDYYQAPQSVNGYGGGF